MKKELKRLGNYLLDAQARLSAIKRGSTIEIQPAINDVDKALSILKELSK